VWAVRVRAARVADFDPEVDIPDQVASVRELWCVAWGGEVLAGQPGCIAPGLGGLGRPRTYQQAALIRTSAPPSSCKGWVRAPALCSCIRYIYTRGCGPHGARVDSQPLEGLKMASAPPGWSVRAVRSGLAVAVGNFN